jgi:hypothetical protein
VPDGFEVYESIRGQVFLRRIQVKLISDDEQDCILRGIEGNPTKRSYKIEVRGKTLTIHESSADFDERFGKLDRQAREEWNERFMSFQAVVRFILVDPDGRLFAPERYCFRGSVDDWISIGPSGTIENLASIYLEHLGQDTLFELY